MYYYTQNRDRSRLGLLRSRTTNETSRIQLSCGSIDMAVRDIYQALVDIAYLAFVK